MTVGEPETEAYLRAELKVRIQPSSSGESTNFRFLSRRRPLIRRAAGVHPRRGMASLAMRQIDDAFFDNGRARAAGQRAARRDELPAADPARSVSSHDDRRPAVVEKEKTRNSAAEPAGASRRRQSVISPRRELLGQSSGVNARTQNAAARIPVGSPNDKTHS